MKSFIDRDEIVQGRFIISSPEHKIVKISLEFPPDTSFVFYLDNLIVSKSIHAFIHESLSSASSTTTAFANAIATNNLISTGQIVGGELGEPVMTQVFETPQPTKKTVCQAIRNMFKRKTSTSTMVATRISTVTLLATPAPTIGFSRNQS